MSGPPSRYPPGEGLAVGVLEWVTDDVIFRDELIDVIQRAARR